MKILQLIPSLSPLSGGPARSIPALCKSLMALGHEVDLWATTFMETPTTLADTDRADNHIQKRIFIHRPCVLAPGMPASREMINELSKVGHTYDIVHVHSLWNPAATFSLRYLRKAGIPYCISLRGVLDPVVTKRNRWKKIPWTLLWERKNVERAALLHFTTEGELEKARESGWNLPASIVVPNIVDVDFWKETPRKQAFEEQYPELKGKDVVLFVGRIDWVKNIDRLIRAICLMRESNPQVMLVCIGPDNDGHQSVLESLARSLNVSDSVLFTGMLSRGKLREAFARGQVLALISEKENFGMAAAEALAAGLPIVLSEGVGIAYGWASKGPVARVSTETSALSASLSEMLSRAIEYGKPDREAQALAEREWGANSTKKLVSSYEAAIANRER